MNEDSLSAGEVMLLGLLDQLDARTPYDRGFPGTLKFGVWNVCEDGVTLKITKFRGGRLGLSYEKDGAVTFVNLDALDAITIKNQLIRAKGLKFSTTLDQILSNGG